MFRSRTLADNKKQRKEVNLQWRLEFLFYERKRDEYLEVPYIPYKKNFIEKITDFLGFLRYLVFLELFGIIILAILSEMLLFSVKDNWQLWMVISRAGAGGCGVDVSATSTLPSGWLA